MQARRIGAPNSVATLAFIASYCSLLIWGLNQPVRHSDVIAPSAIELALYMGWLPSGVVALVVYWILAWLNYVLPRMAYCIVSGLVILSLLTFPVGNQVYQSTYSEKALYQQALVQAALIPPETLSNYFESGSREIRKRAFLEQYAQRTVSSSFSAEDLLVIETLLREALTVSSENSGVVQPLFRDWLLATLSQWSIMQLIQDWPSYLYYFLSLALSSYNLCRSVQTI